MKRCKRKSHLRELKYSLNDFNNTIYLKGCKRKSHLRELKFLFLLYPLLIKMLADVKESLI